jgi:hypothetical protein
MRRPPRPAASSTPPAVLHPRRPTRPTRRVRHLAATRHGRWDDHPPQRGRALAARGSSEDLEKRLASCALRPDQAPGTGPVLAVREGKVKLAAERPPGPCPAVAACRGCSQPGRPRRVRPIRLIRGPRPLGDRRASTAGPPRRLSRPDRNGQNAPIGRSAIRHATPGPSGCSVNMGSQMPIASVGIPIRRKGFADRRQNVTLCDFSCSWLTRRPACRRLCLTDRVVMSVQIGVSGVVTLISEARSV